ncbi:MAG: chromate transporter [Acutalibacteraceae bacterium]|nr:chromate transporter [Acutalibacteraceae bacterium]
MIYLELFLTFLKIGAFTFGGGYAMLPLIQQEVTAKGWMELEQLVNFIAVSESTPGPFAINIATYVGSQVAPIGILGSACATLGVVFPSFVIILIVAKIYDRFKKSKSVQGVMSGLKPAVVGLIGSAIISIALTVFLPSGFSLAVFKTAQFYVSLAICAVATVLAFKKVHPIIIICLSALVGIATGYLI